MGKLLANLFQFFGVCWLMLGFVLLLFIPVLGVLIVSLGIGMLMVGGLLSLPESAFDEGSKPRSYWMRIGWLGLIPPLGFVSIAMWHWGGGREIKNAYKSGGGRGYSRAPLSGTGSGTDSKPSWQTPNDTCRQCQGGRYIGSCSCGNGWIDDSPYSGPRPCPRQCDSGKIRCPRCRGSGKEPSLY